MLQNIIIVGPPGSGKGTMAKKIAKDYSLEHISTGELIRHELAKGNSKILPYKDSLSKGNLLPDEIVLELIKEKFEKKRHFILDGFPRTIDQAKILDSSFQKHNIPMSTVLKLCLDDDLVKKRIAGRRECKNCDSVYNIHFSPPQKENICDDCGSELYSRADDKPESVEHRLEIYKSRCVSAEAYYREKGILIEIDASGSPAEAYSKVKKVLDTL